MESTVPVNILRKDNSDTKIKIIRKITGISFLNNTFYGSSKQK